MRQLSHDLYAVWDFLKWWSQKTFGSDDERGPIGPLKHLVKEIETELLPPNDPTDINELADVLILLVDATRRAGHTMENLSHAAISKCVVLSERKYQRPRGDEISEHIK